jgi:hypothetical protein
MSICAGLQLGKICGHRRIVAALCLLAFISVPVLADEPAWLTGEGFDQALELPLTANWSNLPFRDAIPSLAKSRRVAILIDRRIDADALFSLRIQDEPLRVAFQKIAASKGVAVSFANPVVYFGPTEAAGKLRTVAELVRQQALRQPLPMRTALVNSQRLNWVEATEPRQLVAKLAEEVRLPIRGLDQVPHDLWRAANLPRLPWFERMLLVLVQFDRGIAIAHDGKSLEIVPLPARPRIERRYASGATPSARLAQLCKQFPQAEVIAAGPRIAVRADLETHAQIADLVGGKQTKTTTVKNLPETYTLNVERLPLEKVLTQLAGMLKLELTFDRPAIDQAEISLDQLVTFSVKDASLDELLTAAFKDTNLKFVRDGKQVRILPD